MLHTELSRRKQQALAREIKKYIEQEDRLIKEAELRQLLSKHDIEGNLKDIKNLFESFYVEETIKKLVDKIQPSVVWDTSLVKLETKKIYELFYNTSQTNIFIASVMKEIEKKIMEGKVNNRGKFRYLYYSILADSNSEHSTIVDYESNESYTDNQILQFAEENMYHIYTCDYVMGLRAKARKINVIIFNSINEENTPKYIPVADGKNIIITPEILKCLNIGKVVDIATLLKANKFILPFEFIEMLESEKDNTLIREYITFFVFDKNEDYTIFTSQEDGSDYGAICQKYNALVLTPSSSIAIDFKKKQIPYYYILSQNELELMKNFNMELNEEEPDSSLTDSSEQEQKNDEISKTLLISNEFVSSQQFSKIPNYNPLSNTVKYNPLEITSEKMWVLNGKEKEVRPNANFFPTQSFTALPGYYVIHGTRNLDGTFSLTVYQIIEKNTFKTGRVLYQDTFFDEKVVPTKYRHYATVLKHLT